MKLKSNKGFTGIDITIALTIIIIFVSVIVTLLYNFSLVSKKVERQGKASYIIVNVLEKLKQMDFDDVRNEMDTTNLIQEDDYKGYNIDIEVKDHADNSNIEENQDVSIKEVKVTVEYKVGKSTEEIDISTILVKTDE